MRTRTRKNTDLHSDWLTQVDVEGPFLAYPVVKDMWPDGVDRLGDSDDRLVTFKQAYAQWQRALDHYVTNPKTSESKVAYDLVRWAWIDVVLNDMAEWEDLRGEAEVTVRSPGEQITVTATGTLVGRDGSPAALLLVCDQSTGLREAGLDGWAANDVDRLAMLLRKAGIEVGIVTDGQWWALVWAKEGKPTGSGMVNALTWAEEPLLRDAFFTLINQRRFRAPDEEQRLSRMFERSELEAEEITEALGTQVRRSVELLVQAFSEARLEAAKAGDLDPLTEKPDDVYQAAVTVMMRIVFLLFAEERDMLPTEQLYWDSYAIKDLLDDLRTQAAGGEEQLDESFDTWHRLLAVSQALHGGVNYDEMRMPAYGGSLLDPSRFPWLHAPDDHGLRLKVSDRVMLHVLESVQTVVFKGERRRISFREIDVEQIGYIYEGLLGYSCSNVTDGIILGLVGKDGEEPEIPLGALNDLYDRHGGDAKAFAAALVEWTKANQPAASGKTPAALVKLLAKEPAAEERAELVRLLSPVASGDSDLLETLVGWGALIRRDLRNIPLVFRVGGLVVVETPSRRNAGAHYTPRSLAEEVVEYALQPLVYEPGPLQTNDSNGWKRKSSAEILDLKVADIAAGSGAFLVAAARYLSERLVEAWVAEGLLDGDGTSDPEGLKLLALREVIARCLYGADINPMAVEMCKLSLWLVSMDKSKPFSFVDDKVFCGNSLLGLTSLDQLRDLHIYPSSATKQQQLLVDIDAKIASATRLREELATPIDERDPMRSARAKDRLLEQFHEVTSELRIVGDAILAAALPFGGKPGRQLDDVFKTMSMQLHDAFPADGSDGDSSSLVERIDSGLAPVVETDYVRWEPLHWVVEIPDVLISNGGFDAIVGNPPFLAGKKIATAYGANLEQWLKQDLAGQKGSADLCAHFIRRARTLLNSSGVLGLIATDRVGQGDTAAMSTELLARDGDVFRARSHFIWPGKAKTGAAIIWATRSVRRAQQARAFLDETPVSRISGSLKSADIADLSNAVALQPEFQAGNGVSVYGEGFFLSADDPLVQQLNHVERAALRPFVNGQTLMSGAESETLVISLNEFQTESALVEAAPCLAERLERLVKPVRDGVTSQVHETRYWAHWDKREKLFREAHSLERFITLARMTRVPVFTFSTDRSAVISDKVVVLATDSLRVLGALSSIFHTSWFESTRTTRGAGSCYVVSRCLRTFPLPESRTADLTEAARRFDAVRELARLNVRSLTKLYNLVDDPAVTDHAIAEVRTAQADLDRAVCASYGWEDLKLDHGFVEIAGARRFGCPDDQREEMRRRLLDENLLRAGVASNVGRGIEQEGLFA